MGGQRLTVETERERAPARLKAPMASRGWTVASAGSSARTGEPSCPAGAERLIALSGSGFGTVPCALRPIARTDGHPVSAPGMFHVKRLCSRRTRNQVLSVPSEGRCPRTNPTSAKPPKLMVMRWGGALSGATVGPTIRWWSSSRQIGAQSHSQSAVRELNGRAWLSQGMGTRSTAADPPEGTIVGADKAAVLAQ